MIALLRRYNATDRIKSSRTWGLYWQLAQAVVLRTEQASGIEKLIENLFGSREEKKEERKEEKKEEQEQPKERKKNNRKKDDGL